MPTPPDPSSSSRPGLDLRGRRRLDARIRARWFFDGRRLVESGWLEVESGVVRQIEVGPRALERSASFEVDLLMPGLVNAHAHLDLSGLEGEFPAGDDFTRWLEQVRAHRPEVGPGQLSRAVERGLGELVASGTTSVIDFSSGGVSREPLGETAVPSLVLHEMVGLVAPRDGEALDEVGRWLERHESGLPGNLRLGLAPHAPYSTSRRLLEGVARLWPARPRSIHLAEDPAERELLERGEGPFRDFLLRLGFPATDLPEPGPGPLELLRGVGFLDDHALLVHGGDLREEEIDLLGSTGAGLVFCPGTHEYFSRPRHPLLALHRRGVPLALGTDSSASNACLSMLRELHLAALHAPEIPLEEMMAIACGLRLPGGFREERGIAEGRPVDLAAWSFPGSASRSDPRELLGEAASCRLTVARGRILLESPV